MSRAYLVDEQGRTFAVVVPADDANGWVAAPLSWGEDAQPSCWGPTARDAWSALTSVVLGGMVCRPFDADTAAALQAER